MMTFQLRQCLGEDLEDQEPPYNLFLQSRTHIVLEEQEDKEKESPGAGSCRLLSRVAGSGAKPKVNHPLISPLPSLRLYPCMCGLNPEHVLRPGFSPVDPSSIPGVLTSRGWPNKGPADDYPPSKLQKLPHPGLAEGQKQPVQLQQRPLPPRKLPHLGLAEGSELPVQLPQKLPLSREQPRLRPAVCSKQPMLQQRSSSPRGRPPKGLADGHHLPVPRGQPQQVGFAEVLPGRLLNLPGPRT